LKSEAAGMRPQSVSGARAPVRAGGEKTRWAESGGREPALYLWARA
jgi:hypothetical protein